MKITICGSIKFIKEMMETKQKLVELGHDVLVPLSAEIGQTKQYWIDLKQNKFDEFLVARRERMLGHFDKIKSSDAILVLNYDKEGIKNYIGGATFGEMMVAFKYNKKIFLLNPIPTDEKLAVMRDEIECVKPVVINGNLDLIK